ncbi:hypothetical protein K2X05_12305 [bacterium]|nr:hypothetical protein [bacterium]
MKIVIFLTIVMLTHVSFAKFESEGQLFAAFNSIGMNTIVEITDVNLAKNLLVHKTTENSTNSISDFKESIPMPELNYTETSSSWGISTETQYKAFSVAEIVLCYTSNKISGSRSMIVPKNNFEKCYLLPSKIKDVVSRIKSL